MARLDRDDIKLISSHSNLPSDKIHALLSQFVYSSGQSWKKFLRIFFISIAVGFLSAGIIMFFAYNWTALGKFSKLGLIELLLLVAISFVLFSKLKEDIRDVILTGASMLVGVLFAVFGQIYQTGANAYDFFLGWTISILLWVAIANFPALWLLFLLLLQTTFVLYAVQIAVHWSPNFVAGVLFLINLAALGAFIILPTWRQRIQAPSWMIKTIALAAVTTATIGMTSGIFDSADRYLAILAVLITGAYSFGIYYGLKQRRAFYLTIISLSVVVIISDLLIRIGTDAGMFFFTFLFIVISVTLIIRKLISLQKKWAGE